MKKQKQKKRDSKPKSISERMLHNIQHLLKTKVIDISLWRDGRLSAENYQKTIISTDELSKLDPAHAVYVYGQNMLSQYIEQIAQLHELSGLVNDYAEAEDEYLPSGPPMSPLTGSYFFCWGSFDLRDRTTKETFCRIIIDIYRFLNANTDLKNIFEKMQNSRMGLYVHEGRSDRYILLRELITNKKIKAVVPSGYYGVQGEIWLARVMPPPFELDAFNYHVVFTTPYIIGELKDRGTFLGGNEKSWIDFFERNLSKMRCIDKIAAYERLMKYGLERNYWNEYIFCSYVHHKNDMILLAGFPDIPESMLHTPQGEKRLLV